MKLKQISIFLENKTGRLAAALDLLGKNGINLSAFSLADTTDFGVARMIVDDCDKAKEVFKEAGIVVKVVEVFATNVADEPGALVHLLEKLSDGGVSVEYMYAFFGKASEEALMVFKVDDVAKAEEIVK
jgi:hypothetical protein